VGLKGIRAKANILCVQPPPHPSFAPSSRAHLALCVPVPPFPPILCAVIASHPALCASSPSSVQHRLVRAAELRVAGKLHFVAKIHARTLYSETCVLLSSAHYCCTPPILCVVAGSKGKQSSHRTSGQGRPSEHPDASRSVFLKEQREKRDGMDSRKNKKNNL